MAGIIMKDPVGDIGGSDSNSGSVVQGPWPLQPSRSISTLIPPTQWWVEIILAALIFLAVRAVWAKA